jgi:ribonuclease P/MRP protein subunit POP1
MQSEKSTIEQRNILFSEFLDARSLEISNMDRILSEKMLATTKLAFQLLPKHMRRRPMSHNKYRIPSRIRLKTPDNPLKKPIKCRKHLRKSSALAWRYEMRDSKNYWLENHLFQAKRMKMIEYFNYKIPVHPNNKSERACYRFFSHDAVMYDLSYYIIIEFEANEEVLRKALSRVLEAKDLQKVFQEESLKGFKTGRVFLWKNKDKGDLIGPVEFFFKPIEKEDSKRNLWFLGHPGLKEEIIEIFKDDEAFKFKLIENTMNIFHIFGPKSLSRVIETMKKVGFEEQKSEGFIKWFKIVTDPGIYPKGSLMHVNFEKILDKKKLISEKKEFVSYKSQKIETYDKEKGNEINKAIVDIFGYEIQKKTINFSKEKSVWNLPNKSHYLKRFRNVVRGRYTHKKLNQDQKKIPGKLSRKERKQLKLSTKLEKMLKQTQLKENPILSSNMNIEANVEIKLAEKEKRLESTCLNLMISFDSHINPSGLKIFVPMGSGLLIWRLLHFANIKILGLREYENILHEKKNLVFPIDYPFTKTQNSLAEIKKQELIKKYFNRPPKNRLNYQRIGFPYPFQSDFSRLGTVYKDLLAVEIKMMFKGVPKDKAIICMLQKEDLELVGKMLQNPKENSGIVYREKLKARALGNLKKLNDIKLDEELRKVVTEREIIGFLTQGDFSKNDSRGAGIGFVKKGIFNKENDIFGLVRNPNSRYYYLCEIKLLSLK